MPIVKRNVKDSVFVKMFKEKKYLVQLYQSLHPEDKVTEDDLELVSIESVLVNDAYNDLGFLAKDKLVILVEAQSSWSENIIIRMFIYLAKTYQDYIYSNKMHKARLYSETKIMLPAPELYVIYTGNKEGKKSVLSLKDEFLAGYSDCLELKANVIFADDNRQDIIGQYIDFCVILKKQIKAQNGDKLKAIQETIRICIEENNIKEYLSQNKKEVEAYMFALLTEEEMDEAVVDNTRLNDLEAFISIMKEDAYTFEEIYKKVSTKSVCSGFSKETIKEIFEQV